MLSIRPDVLVTFGDSLSDAGTIAGVTGLLLPFTLPFDDSLIAPAYAGVWSNGPVHSQWMPTLLGSEALVYATGAARALGTQELRDTLGPAALFIRFGLDPDLRAALLDFDLNFGGQVTRFLEADAVYPGGPAPDLRPRDDVAGVVLVGLNDIGDLADTFDVTDPEDVAAALTLPGTLTAAVEAQAERLAASGDLDALVFYAPPPIRFFPTGTAPVEGVAAMDALVESYTAGLTGVAARIEAAFGIETEVVDLGLLTGQIDADPGTFGFRAKGPYYEGQGTDPDIDGIDLRTGLPRISFPVNPAVADLPLRQIAFFDEVHWSAALHGVVAAFAAAALTSDLIALGNGPQAVRGARGADLVLAGGGRDTVLARAGADVVLGGRGADTVHGQNGRDILSGGAGPDRLTGGPGGDVLAGGAGADVLRGGAGRDILSDGAGNDRVLGGGGADVFVWVAPEVRGLGGGRADLFRGGGGTDVLYLVTEAAARDRIEAAMADRSATRIERGAWSFDSIGVRATGVESVVLLSNGVAGLEDLSAPNAGLLEQAQLWGIL